MMDVFDDTPAGEREFGASPVSVAGASTRKKVRRVPFRREGERKNGARLNRLLIAPPPDDR